MRKFFRFLGRPVVWSTGGLGLLLLSLYVVCGLLGLEDRRWVVELLVGVPLALLLITYWGRRVWTERRLQRELRAQARHQAQAAGPDALRDLQALEQDFTRAFNELTQTTRERGLVGGTAALPWILVMGLPGAGKSTALDRAGLRFTALGRRVQGIAGTRNCTWWFSSEAVLLDTAGRYAIRDEDRDEWRAFLQLLAKRRQRPIDAVMVQLGIDELLQRRPDEIERTAVLLRERLDELMRGLQVQCPIHLVFNKCDLLDGFIEFFSGLGDSERLQPWGFSLDLTELRGQPLGAAFRERYDQLVAALTERLTQRLMEPLDADGREAVLCFPAEVAAVRDALCAFTEVFSEPVQGSERPWLTAVYLTSAFQTGPRLPGERQRHLRELGVPPVPAASRAPESTTYFLRGVFSHIIRYAEHAARPSVARQKRMRLRHRIAVAAGALGCMAASALLGRQYSAQSKWLKQLETNAEQLMRTPELPQSAARADRDSIRQELTNQAAFLSALETGSGASLSSPRREARALLRYRIDQSWLRPLHGLLAKDLISTSRRDNADPGEEFDRGYRVLKATYILQGQQCPSADPDDAREFVTQYLIEQWRRALAKEGSLLAPGEADHDRPRARMERSLHFFLSVPPAELKNNSLNFPEEQRQQARLALQNNEKDPSVLFKLRASNANLYSRQPQLGTGLIVDTGIEQVFTTQGCIAFFRDTTRGQEWWPCILGIQEPREAADVEDIYRRHYTQSWDRWLRELSLRPLPAASEPTGNGAAPRIAAGSNPSTEALGVAIRLLDGLLREPRPAIAQVLSTLGRGIEERFDARVARAQKTGFFGCRNKMFSRTVERSKSAYNAAKLPIGCELAQEKLAAVVQLVANKDKAPEEGETVGLREEFGKYREAIQALRSALINLRDGGSNKRPAGALKMVLSHTGSTGELWSAHMARRNWIDAMQAQVGPHDVNFASSGLERALTEGERMAWSALLPIASQALDDQWRLQVVDAWARIWKQEKLSGDTQAELAKKAGEFFKENGPLDSFVRNVLTPLYAGNPKRCELGSMAEPFTQRIEIRDDRCRKVMSVWEYGLLFNPDKAVSPEERSATSDPISADVALPRGQPGCSDQGEEVRMDNGTKIFSCAVTTGRCSELQGVSSSRRARLLVKWRSLPSHTVIYEAERPEGLSKHGHMESGRMVFPVPVEKASGRCSGYQIRLTMSTPPGGSGPKKTDTRWKEHNLLPTSLIH